MDDTETQTLRRRLSDSRIVSHTHNAFVSVVVPTTAAVMGCYRHIQGSCAINLTSSVRWEKKCPYNIYRLDFTQWMRK
jgi:hypothetical protein